MLIFLFIFGCATPQKREARETGNCRAFDETIHTCAKESGHPKLFSTLRKIARCETGNKCIGHIDSPNGLYHGAFQFAPLTWENQCEPFFKERNIEKCENENSIYDICCSAICTSQIISRGGIGNWPTCGL